MNLKELHDLAAKLLTEGVDPTLTVGVRGHYGELETELEGLTLRNSEKWRRGARHEQFIALDGIPSRYPEPD